jgi:hypothetical protein
LRRAGPLWVRKLSAADIVKSSQSTNQVVISG